jgi:hypothetical protein
MSNVNPTIWCKGLCVSPVSDLHRDLRNRFQRVSVTTDASDGVDQLEQRLSLAAHPTVVSALVLPSLLAAQAACTR